MNKTLFILLILISNFGLGQNLIPNPSFEVYDTCPTTLSSPGDYQINHALGWYSPTYATSDYYNVCNSTLVSVPSNWAGYQIAMDGDGYAGFLMEFGPPHWFEYIQAKLNLPLIKGYKYEVSFFISLANSSDFAVKKIGAWFTNNQISSINPLPLFNYLPEIRSDSNVFLSDTLNWAKIEGEFIATGGEEYITIGYYSDTNYIDTLRINPFASSASFSIYYYIDGIEIKETIPTIIIPNIITPNGDDNNDLFQLNFPYEKVIIFNRWGQQLFASNNNESYWDGRTSNGKEVPDGTYYYIITTKEDTYKGFVQVIR